MCIYIIIYTHTISYDISRLHDHLWTIKDALSRVNGYYKGVGNNANIATNGVTKCYI